MPEAPESDAPPRAVLIAAVVVAVGGIAGVLGIAANRHTSADQSGPRPVAIAAVPAPAADGPECRALLATLPDRLGDYHRAETAEPTPVGTAAWRSDADDADPVILRCGLDRPAEFVVGSPVQLVGDGNSGSGVQWFRLDDPDVPRSTWVVVDRPAYVALTQPSGAGSAPIQTLSEVIDRTMPAMPIRPGPAR